MCGQRIDPEIAECVDIKIRQGNKDLGHGNMESIMYEDCFVIKSEAGAGSATSPCGFKP